MRAPLRAAAIHGRFGTLFDGRPAAEAFLGMPTEQLRAVALSAAKTASILDLAATANLIASLHV